MGQRQRAARHEGTRLSVGRWRRMTATDIRVSHAIPGRIRLKIDRL